MRHLVRCRSKGSPWPIHALVVLALVPALASSELWAQPSSASQPATVLSIGDGDTIRLTQAGQTVTVRLACIDAPETAQSPYGQQARRYLQQRLPIGRSITLNVKATDRYGRSVAEVISGVNINLAMVEDGQAFAYRRYLGNCNARDYLDAEDRARRRRLGVWQVPGGITRPWDYRRQRKGGTSLTAVPRQLPAETSAGNPLDRRYRCREIGSFAEVQQLLRQGHTYLDRVRDGGVCEILR